LGVSALHASTVAAAGAFPFWELGGLFMRLLPLLRIHQQRHQLIVHAAQVLRGTLLQPGFQLGWHAYGEGGNLVFAHFSLQRLYCEVMPLL